MSEIIKPIAQPVIEQVMTNPKAQAAIASVSMGVGVGSTMEILQGVFGLTLTFLSIVLTSVLIYKNLRQK